MSQAWNNGSGRLIPCSLAYIDRSNLGNAKIAGMEEDLNLIGLRYNTALTVFFVPYALLEVPSNVGRIAARWASRCLTRTDRSEDAPALHLDLNPLFCMGTCHGEYSSRPRALTSFPNHYASSAKAVDSSQNLFLR